MRKLILLALVMFVSLSAAAQTADDLAKKNALQRFDEGVVLVDKGQYEEARLKFVQAYAVIQKPALLFNLAVTEEKTNRATSAAAHFRKLLKDPTTPGNLRVKADKMMAEMAPKLSRVVVHAPNGADVSIDGVVVGRAPIDDPIDVTPGTHDVAIVLDDKRAQVRRESKANEEQIVELQFVDASASATATIAPTATAVPTSTAPVEPNPFWNGRRIIGASVAGAGVVGGAIAIGFGASAIGNENDAATLRAGKPSNACVGVTTGDCATLASKASAGADQTNIAVALGVISSAVFVTGAVIFFLPSSSNRSAASIQLSPTLGGFMLSGKF